MELFVLFCSGVLLGVVYVLQKKLSAERFHPATFVFLTNAVGALLALPLLFYQFRTLPSLFYWILTILSVAFYGFGNLFAFKAYKETDASIVGLISRLNIIVTAVLGISMLKESYTPLSYVALALIFAGSLLVVYERGKLRMNAGILYAILMAGGYGVAAVIDKELLRHFSPYTYVVINIFLVSLLFSSFRQARKEAFSLFVRQPVLVVLISLLSTSAWIGFLLVLQSGSVSKVFPIFDSLALVSTVGAGILFLKERTKVVQKITGTIIVLTGIFLL